MPNIVGVRFKKCGKIYDFEINGVEVSKASQVVVESSFGLTIGFIVTEVRYTETLDKPLKKVLRLVSEEDERTKAENGELEKEAAVYCLERIHTRGLPMKLIYTEVTLDKKRIVFYFTADGRIDFRELVKDLASRFKTRIEMRQIGVRDEAKIIGGLGVCGREVCCRTFLASFAPISIKMAKRQDLVLNPGKLSGLCGRLMCCLGYEVDEGRDVMDASEDDVAALEEEVIAAELTEKDTAALNKSWMEALVRREAEAEAEQKAEEKAARRSDGSAPAGEHPQRRPQDRQQRRPSGPRQDQGQRRSTGEQERGVRPDRQARPEKEPQQDQGQRQDQGQGQEPGSRSKRSHRYHRKKTSARPNQEASAPANRTTPSAPPTEGDRGGSQPREQGQAPAAQGASQDQSQAPHERSQRAPRKRWKPHRKKENKEPDGRET